MRAESTHHGERDADLSDAATLMVSAASRALRRQLRPLVWVALEEVALDAVYEADRFVARTSARQVAERLGVDPGTAAGALRDLRRQGLLTLEREQGPSGRFGLSVYVLGSISGLTVVSPSADPPCTALSSVDTSLAVESDSVSPRPSGPRSVRSCAVTPCSARPIMDMLSLSTGIGPTVLTNSGPTWLVV